MYRFIQLTHISTNFFPRFSKFYALGDIDRLREEYLRITKLSLAIMMPIAICLFFWGESLVALWVGEGHFVGLPVFSAFVLMDIFHAIGTPSGALLQAIGQNRAMTYSELVNAGLHLLLSVWLIQRMGLLGVALAVLISHLLTSFWVVMVQSCRYTQLSLKGYLRMGVCPPLLCGLVVFLLVSMSFGASSAGKDAVSLVLRGFGAGAIYLAVFVLFGMRSEERKFYQDVFFQRFHEKETVR